MIGPFPKDIWGLIFREFEYNFDPYALNNLSLTCKKLYEIDMQHKKNYISRRKKIGYDEPIYKKGRHDYVTLLKYGYLMQYLHNHSFCMDNYRNIYQFVKLLKIGNLSKMEALSETQMTKLILTLIDVGVFQNYYLKDIMLISNRLPKAPLYCCLLAYLQLYQDVRICISTLGCYYGNFR